MSRLLHGWRRIPRPPAVYLQLVDHVLRGHRGSALGGQHHRCRRTGRWPRACRPWPPARQRRSRCPHWRRCPTGSRPIRRTCSSGQNTLIPVMAGPPKSCRAVWAHFTATRSHTTAGLSMTTASISQWLRQALHPQSCRWHRWITSPASRSSVGTRSPLMTSPKRRGHSRPTTKPPA